MKLLKTVKNKLFEEAGLGDGIKPFWKIKQDNLPHEYELLVFFLKIMPYLEMLKFSILIIMNDYAVQ